MILAAVLALVLTGDTVSEAEAAYRAGRFEEAAVLFERQLDRDGGAVGPLLFNLGTAQLRAGHPAQAIAAYRSALRYLPRSARVRVGLRFAEERLGVAAANAAAEAEASSLWTSLDGVLSRSEQLIVAGLLQAVGLVFALCSRPRSRLERIGWGVAHLGLLLGLTLWVRPLDSGANRAVVVAAELTVRSSGDPGAPVVARLRAGELVTVRESAPAGEAKNVEVTHPRGSGVVPGAALAWIR